MFLKLLIPLFLIYIWNRNFRSSAFKSIAAWIGLYTSIVLVGFLPLIFARHLDYSTVSSPEALRLFAGQIPLGDGRALFIGVLAVAFALGRLCLSTRLTPNGLLMGAGVVMSSLICFTDVAPGWFYWPLPFFALFMSLYLTAPRTLYWSLLGAFFIYYVALANFPALNIPFLSNLIFTFQQFCLVSMTFVVLYLDLKFSAPMFGRIQPVQIGIAGDSGTGKNSVILTFQKIFGDAFTLVVEGDDYHRWERGADQWHQITHLDPKANLLKKLHSDARLIRRGISAFQPQYNHETGRFTTSRERRPVKTVFYQGLHTFYYPSLRSQLDVRIFLRPDENLRLFWKIRRDSQERGHSVEKIVSDLARREEDSRIHIAPQAHYADWIIRIKIEQDLSIERLLSGEPFTLIAEYKLRNEPALIDLLDLLRNCGAIEILSEETTSNLESMSVVFKGSPTADTIREIAEKWFAPIRHISRSNKSPIFSSGLDGIHQLFLLALLQLKREMENA